MASDARKRLKFVSAKDVLTRDVIPRDGSGAMINIGVIEDEAVHRELVTTTLERAGFGVVAFGSVHEFNRRSVGDVDLILLDWQLPGESGIDFLRTLRANEEGVRLPVIFLTGHGEEERVVEALHAGADDYVVKPARHAELVARVEAVLRRNSVTDAAPEVDFAPFRFRPEQRDVLLHGTPMVLSSREYDLLCLLLRQRLQGCWPWRPRRASCPARSSRRRYR